MTFRTIAAALGALSCLTGLAFAQPPTAPSTPAAASSKKMPMRDAKGHFMKMSGKKGGSTGKHMLPPRDAKGRFMKMPHTMRMSGKKGGAMMGKKMPARDPKTGRFIKSKM